MSFKRYKKRDHHIVTGVQLDLHTDGFVYRKWGAEQRCKAGDWLVNNNGDCYTISKESFANTYKQVAPGQFIKTSLLWARQASVPGKVKTQEGSTEYLAGDYIVSNNEDGSDSYAVGKKLFEKKYCPA